MINRLLFEVEKKKTSILISLLFLKDLHRIEINIVNILGLPNTAVISFLNLATTVLLLAVVWVILGPILTGQMVLVEANNQNARTDIPEYGQGMYYDTLSDSASNLYNWWMEQYFPENLQNIDKYQTNYDADVGSSDNRRTDDAYSSENYNEYSG